MPVTYHIPDVKAFNGLLGQIIEKIQAGLMYGPAVVTLDRPKRSKEQNAAMWAALTDVSNQVEWHGQKLTPKDWKHVFSASLNGQRSVPGLDGGFVVLGVSTSKQSKEWMSNLLELIYAFGSERGVKWSEAA